MTKFENLPGKDTLKERVEFRKKQRQTRLSTTTSKDRYWPGSDFEANSVNMSTEDDDDYLHMMLLYYDDFQYLIDGQLQAVEYGALVGHWDERVAAQETAYSTYCDVLLKIIFNTLPMMELHDLLKSYPISTTDNLTIGDGKTGNTTVPLLSKTQINDYLQDLINMQAVIPNWIDSYVKKFAWIWKRTEEWYKGGVTIPPQYFMPIAPKSGTTDTETLITSLKTNVSKAKKFMNFFGIGRSDINEKVFEYQTKKTLDNDMISYLANMRLSVYGDDGGVAARQLSPGTSPAGATASTAYKWFFPSGQSPDFSELSALIKTMYGRSADYNKWGGCFTFGTPATQNYISLFKCKEDEATEMVSGQPSGFWGLVKMFRAMWETSATDKHNISITGTYYTADMDLLTAIGWPLLEQLDLKYYIKHCNLVDGIIVKWLSKHSGFTSVKK